MNAPLPLREFCDLLHDEAGIVVPADASAATALDDLTLDSIQLFALEVFMDELGCDIPVALRPHIVTLGDLHYHYTVRVGYPAA